ncbi:MAG: hypothetical protein RL150_548 [Candidatus Parcubacteria bacterium]
MLARVGELVLPRDGKPELRSIACIVNDAADARRPARVRLVHQPGVDFGHRAVFAAQAGDESHGLISVRDHVRRTTFGKGNSHVHRSRVDDQIRIATTLARICVVGTDDAVGVHCQNAVLAAFAAAGHEVELAEIAIGQFAQDDAAPHVGAEVNLVKVSGPIETDTQVEITHDTRCLVVGIARVLDVIAQLRFHV